MSELLIVWHLFDSFASKSGRRSGRSWKNLGGDVCFSSGLWADGWVGRYLLVFTYIVWFQSRSCTDPPLHAQTVTVLREMWGWGDCGQAPWSDFIVGEKPRGFLPFLVKLRTSKNKAAFSISVCRLNLAYLSQLLQPLFCPKNHSGSREVSRVRGEAASRDAQRKE